MSITPPLLLSLKVASFATLLVIAFGLPIAWFLARRAARSRPITEAVVLLPLMLPPTVVGYYLLSLISPTTAFGSAYRAVFGADIVFTIQAAIVAASVGSFPLFVRQAQTALHAIPVELEEVSRVFGCGKLQTFRLVLLPLAKAGLLAGLCLSFCRALGDFGATLMVAGNIPSKTQTLSLAVYDSLMAGETAFAGLIALLLAGFGVAASLAFTWLAKVQPDTRP